MSKPWPFGDLLPFQYRGIIADPAWQFELRSDKGEAKSAQAQYDCMTTDEMAAMPVADLASGDCVLLMWATYPMIADALRLMAAWGFTYKTGGSWAKQSSTGAKWAFGTGYILRSASEPFLIGTIGDPMLTSKSIRNLIVAPVRGHSRKPDDQYTLMESLTIGPYLELFSRADRAGWDVWGNESGKFNETA